VKARRISVTLSETQVPAGQEAIWLKCRHPSGSFLEFDRRDIEQSVPERFAQIAARYPENIAVRAGRASITYRELDRAATVSMRHLLDSSTVAGLANLVAEMRASKESATTRSGDEEISEI
jgi:non-ribosomal peptide synthetase component F